MDESKPSQHKRNKDVIPQLTDSKQPQYKDKRDKAHRPTVDTSNQLPTEEELEQMPVMDLIIEE